VRVEGMTPLEAREAWMEENFEASEEKGPPGPKGKPSVVVGGLGICAREFVARAASVTMVYFMLMVVVIVILGIGEMCEGDGK
jgi:hypothetical protein